MATQSRIGRRVMVTLQGRFGRAVRFSHPNYGRAAFEVNAD
jgi:hypothetical protein